jgi:cell wall-associated NlpC family hydrolase
VTHTLPARARDRSPALAVLVLCALCACSAIGTSGAAASVSPSGWDAVQQRQVLAGLMSESAGGSFDAVGHLSGVEANATMAALAARLQSAADEQAASGELEGTNEQSVLGEQAVTGEAVAPTAPVVPVVHTAQGTVTVATFDRMLVEELGLAGIAAHVQATAATAGLHPPAYFGSEVVARFLEVRYEQPVGGQRFDLFPGEAITRAEAAWSLAKVMTLSSWSISSAVESLSAFALPQMSDLQRQALQIAVSRIGYPYVWGGTTDNTADGLEHGGFDCSGFAWRVYKVSGLPWGKEILGRTAAEQGGEIPQSQRLSASQLEPGDLLFFGSAHFNSKATESNVIHEGIYLGDNWVIHSSGQGVYVLPLNGSWLGSSFAWGRRVIH